MTDKKNSIKFRKFIRLIAVLTVLFLLSTLLGACGDMYSKEEKEQMQEIGETGKENAIDYIKEKYGIVPTVIMTKVCTERDGAFSHPSIRGCVVVSMKFGGKRFQVHISGESQTLQGTDDYQYDLIKEEAEEYFESLLEYEVYDIYLEYREDQIEGSFYSDDQEENLISELYEKGDFENFMQRHPVYIRIDDCLNQDFTDFPEVKPEAMAFLKKCATDYGARSVLISYRSEADYQSGYSHTYGRGGLLDFDIEQDGLYICSYALFAEEDVEYNCFELQEYDGMVFSCVDKSTGDDLIISGGQEEWLELGETKKAPVSAVYSVDRETAGEITVYIPAEKFSEEWRGKKVYIQHYYKDAWWQYDVEPEFTADEKYIFFTFSNIQGEGFDFAVFS